ncbi:hypothetical protein BKA70DRAFT_1572972 [Coprinopsis sp. MPI-PUGE-AT-0042]|nr:hypothetical protein BKA70DRAFT_1572972 [Coprinopsis sp. MPI-PUGE-AT-0042]
MSDSDHSRKKPKLEKAAKAAETKRRNLQREKEENARREEETRGDCLSYIKCTQQETKLAKVVALLSIEHWKKHVGCHLYAENYPIAIRRSLLAWMSKNKPASSCKVRPAKASSAKLAPDDSNDEEPEPRVLKRGEKKKGNTAKSQPPRAPAMEDSDNEELPVKKTSAKATQSHRPSKKPLNSSESDSGGSGKSLSGSGSESESDDNKSENEDFGAETAQLMEVTVHPRDYQDDHTDKPARSPVVEGTITTSNSDTEALTLFLSDSGDNDTLVKKTVRTKSQKRKRRLVEWPSTDEDTQDAKPKSKRKKQRDEAFEREKPAVGHATSLQRSKKRSQKKNNACAGSSLTRKISERARLRLPSGGQLKDINLLHQPRLVQKVVRSAITKVTEDFLMISAWPTIVLRSTFGGPFLISAADELVGDFPRVAEIRALLDPGQDEDYVQALSHILVGRLALLRNPVKIAGADTIPLYKLGLGDDRKHRVESLLKLDVYIFPGEWARDAKGKETNTWIPNAKDPYLHPAIIETIKQGFFATFSSAATRYVDDFPFVKDKHHLPASMLALAATAVHYGLYRFKDGSKNGPLAFSGDIFSGVYRSHMLALSQMLDTSVKTFNRIMATIFDLTGGLSASACVGGAGAFTVMDLEDDDEEGAN